MMRGAQTAAQSAARGRQYLRYGLRLAACESSTVTYTSVTATMSPKDADARLTCKALACTGALPFLLLALRGSRPTVALKFRAKLLPDEWAWDDRSPFFFLLLRLSYLCAVPASTWR